MPPPFSGAPFLIRCSLTIPTGYGYPALVAFNPSKGKYGHLRSAFEDKSVTQFIESVRLVRVGLGLAVCRVATWVGGWVSWWWPSSSHSG